MTAATPAGHVEQRCVDAIRALAIDAIEEAGSGHPGMPLAMAPAAYVLFARVMRHDPPDPDWPDRDRFVLSAGHASALLYATLHLSGYDVTLDDLRAFRQWGSRTPGHPERDPGHPTPGVEVTTGPLGQGFANGVGMALAERFLRERFGAEAADHHVFALCSDGDLMEGVAGEAASLAGQLGLGRLVYLYDDNGISLDGATSLSFDVEDVTARFEAYGWHVQTVADANDLDALERAVRGGMAERERPSLIRVRSVIGWPAPTKQGTSKAHGSPLGEAEARATKEALGWDPDERFAVPGDVAERFDQRARGGALRAAWADRLAAWRAQDPARAAGWDAAWSGAGPVAGLREALASIDWGERALATRVAGQRAMAAFAELVPTMVGGAADLSESTKTEFPGGEAERCSREHAGRNVYFGVREHAMGAIVNGMAAHGGIARPYGATFLQFADYMRGAIRLSALMRLPVAWVFTHDSVALGEDGPTHQPVEHLAALRAIPGLVVLRPADARETAAAWRTIVEDVDGPAALVLSRQDLPLLDGADADGVARGAYALREPDGAAATIVGTGSEVAVALAAAELLAAEGVAARVVSMPSWELFAAQDETYRDAVLPPGLPAVSVEAGIRMGWREWVDRSVSIERFGASAPGPVALRELGITPERVAQTVRELLKARRTMKRSSM